jgi:hypothetical protein
VDFNSGPVFGRVPAVVDHHPIEVLLDHPLDGEGDPLLLVTETLVRVHAEALFQVVNDQC